MILAVAALAVAVSAYLVRFHLPLEADLSHLLPGDAPSVRDAERMSGRMPAKDTMIALVVAPDPATRAAVA